MRYGNLSGTERYTLDILRLLRERGHECSMVFLGRIKAIGPVLAADQIDYVQFKPRGISAYRSLRKHVSEMQPDVFVQVSHRFVTTLAVWGPAGA